MTIGSLKADMHKYNDWAYRSYYYIYSHKNGKYLHNKLKYLYNKITKIIYRRVNKIITVSVIYKSSVPLYIKSPKCDNADDAPK